MPGQFKNTGTNPEGRAFFCTQDTEIYLYQTIFSVAGSPPPSGVWTSGGALSTGRYGLAGAGTNTAALAFGGYAVPAALACTETYNGSTWSSGGAMITARQYLAGAGISTAALAFGGAATLTPGDVLACTECYNGSAWSNCSAMITARFYLAGAGASGTSALAFGGSTPTALACTETYNGTTWAAGGALSTGRYQLAGAGTNAAALAFGGYYGLTCTESYN